jgi:hypothetical protein
MTEDKKGPGRPAKVNSAGQMELDKAEAQFEKFDNEVKQMTMDRMNASPKQEVEPQTKLSQKEIEKSKDIYLKPYKTIGCRDKFNENYREQYNFDKEYVQFIAENKEIIGEELDIWTRPYGGMPAEEWKVPVNKPVWGPRYLAEQIKRKFYHRLVMQQNTVGSDHAGQYYGTMAVDTTIQRLDAHPVSSRKSIFMGSGAF